MHSCITWHCWWFPVFNPNGLIVFDLEFHSDSWFLRLASSIEYDLFCIWTVHTVASAIWGTQCLGANTLILAWLLPCLTNCTLAFLRLRVFEFRWFPTSITNTEVMGPLTVAASWSRMTIPFDIIFLYANKKNKNASQNIFARLDTGHNGTLKPCVILTTVGTWRYLIFLWSRHMCWSRGKPPDYFMGGNFLSSFTGKLLGSVDCWIARTLSDLISILYVVPSERSKVILG